VAQSIGHKHPLGHGPLTSDVARPLSYKTKTTYFFKTKTGHAKSKTAVLKTIKCLTVDHWRSQKF